MFTVNQVKVLPGLLGFCPSEQTASVSWGVFPWRRMLCLCIYLGTDLLRNFQALICATNESGLHGPPAVGFQTGAMRRKGRSQSLCPFLRHWYQMSIMDSYRLNFLLWEEFCSFISASPIYLSIFCTVSNQVLWLIVIFRSQMGIWNSGLKVLFFSWCSFKLYNHHLQFYCLLIDLKYEFQTYIYVCIYTMIYLSWCAASFQPSTPKGVFELM